MITGEYKVKRQKNGNVHEYLYYRCSKKNKAIKCLEPCVQESDLDKQLSSLIKSVSLPDDWARELEHMASVEHQTSAQSSGVAVKEKETAIQNISQKLERLLNGYLDQIIDEQDYRRQKARLLSEKKSLEGEIASLSHHVNDWLEPLQKWIKDASGLAEIASDSNLFEKKVWAKEIFGSNLRLGARVLSVAAGDCRSGGSIEPPSAWAALRAAHARVGLEPESIILVRRAGFEPA